MTKVIYFEGPKGSGKSSTISELAIVLRDQGYKVHINREPGGTIIGEEIRNILKSDLPRSAECSALLMQASRVEMYHNYLKPIVDADDYKTIVLIDRSILSTIVTQGAIDGVGFVEDMHKLTSEGYTGDLCVWLLPPKDTVFNRLSGRNANYDKLNPVERCSEEWDKYSELAWSMVRTDNTDFFKQHLILDNEDMDVVVATILGAVTGMRI